MQATQQEAITMTTDRKTAIAVGALFLIATAAYIPGNGLILSAVKAPDYLVNVNDSNIFVGVLLEFVNAAAVVVIAVLLYPILRKYSESMALGYAGSRFIESALLLVSALAVPLLLSLGRE